MLAHDCREKERPGTGRETGLGHAGGRAAHGTVAEESSAWTPLCSETGGR